MAKQAVAVEAKPGPVQKAQEFFQEVRQELEKVTWPTMEDVKVSTRVCMYMLAGMVVVIYGFDFIFNNVILALLKLAS
jgi:preprotein translocase SecE subunit